MMKRCAAFLILLGAGGAAAAQGFAWQWPITLPRAGEPAYEVVLTESVYASLNDPLLRDMTVVDGNGRPLPSAMQPTPSRVEVDAVAEAVPWFLLPGETLGSATAAVSDGRFESAGVNLSWRVPAVEEAAMPELLLDLGGNSPSVGAVQVEPAGDGSIWRARIEVMTSSDLQRWSRAAAPTSLYRLEQDGHRLALLRIELERPPQRYLRLRHSADSARGAVAGITVERRGQPLEQREPLRWIALAGTPGADPRSWTYRLPGPLRVEAWNLQAGEGNWVLRARLASRASAEAAYTARGEAERYQWTVDGTRIGSAPAALPGLRDAHWSVELDTEPVVPPTLLLGYRPDRLLFLAESEPPYRLVAGSADLRRTDSPTRAVLAAIRDELGKDWSPPAVSLGQRTELAGEAALVPARRPVDWQTALLWAVLIGVAGSVLVIALKLARPAGGEGDGRA